MHVFSNIHQSNSEVLQRSWTLWTLWWILHEELKMIYSCRFYCVSLKNRHCKLLFANLWNSADITRKVGLHSSLGYPLLSNCIIFMCQIFPFSFLGISQYKDEHDKFWPIPPMHCYGKPAKMHIWPVSLNKIAPKWEKPTDHDPNVISPNGG